MSVNDTDEWASMIINELLDEANTLKSTSKCRSTDNKEADSKDYYHGILNLDKSLSQSANHKDLMNCCDEKIKDGGITSNASGRTSDEINNIVSDLSLISDGNQSIFTDAQSNSNLTSSVELKEIANKTGTTYDSVENIIDERIKNNDVCESEFEMKSSKEEVVLTDLDEAFIQDIEVDLRKAAGLEIELEILPPTGNVKENSSDFIKISHKKSDIPDSSNYREPHYENKEKENECFRVPDNEFSRNSFEKLHLCNDYAALSCEGNCDGNPVQEKNDFKRAKISPVSADLESESESLEESFKRFDEKIELLGFRSVHTGDNRNFKRSNSINELYYRWFEENYVKEEMEYRWGPDDGFIANENLSINRRNIALVKKFKSFSVAENLNGNVNKILAGNLERKMWDLKNKNVIDKNFVSRLKRINGLCANRKHRGFSDAYAKNMNDTFTAKKHQFLGDISGETETNKCPDALGAIRRNEFDEKKNPNKITVTCKNCKNKQEKDGFVEDLSEVDDGELEIRNQTVNVVVSTYRELCSMGENIFIKPFANVLADSYEFLSFVFFLSICLIFMLYENIQILILSYRLLTVNSPFDSFCDEKEKNMIMDCDKSASPITAVEAIFTDKTTTTGNIKDIAKLSLKEKEIMELKDKKSFVKIEPEGISILPMNYEVVTENMKDVYETNSNYLEIFSGRDQYRATVKTNEDRLIDVELLSFNEIEKNEFIAHEKDFDMEVLASSKRPSCDIAETGAGRKIGNPCDLQGTTQLLEGDSELGPAIKISSSSLFEMYPSNSLRNEKPLLNSTEVDGSEMGAIPKHRSFSSCSYFKVSSASNMTYLKGDSKLGTSRRKCLSSSLSVNLPSFSSRSVSLFDSMPLLVKPESLHDNEKMESTDVIQMSNEVKTEVHSFNSSNTDVFEIENSLLHKNEANLKEESDDNSYKYYFDENSLKSNGNSNLGAQSSEVFQISNATEGQFQNALKNTFMYGDTNFMPGLSNTDNGSNLPMTEEAIAHKVKDKLKRKNSLRRRMTLILNNWRNMQVISCVVKNSKSKKNCKI